MTEQRKKLLGPYECDSNWLYDYEEFVLGTRHMGMPDLERQAVDCPTRMISVMSDMTRRIRTGDLSECSPMETLKCLLLQQHWNRGD